MCIYLHVIPKGQIQKEREESYAHSFLLMMRKLNEGCGLLLIGAKSFIPSNDFDTRTTSEPVIALKAEFIFKKHLF